MCPLLSTSLATASVLRFHGNGKTLHGISLGKPYCRGTAGVCQNSGGLSGKIVCGQYTAYTNQRVVYTREFKDTNYAEVDTKIITEQAKDVFVNYKLHLVNNDWKVYDVVIDNVSLINNYRSQFNRVIARSSFENLVRMMKDKQPQGLETTP